MLQPVAVVFSELQLDMFAPQGEFVNVSMVGF